MLAVVRMTICVKNGIFPSFLIILPKHVDLRRSFRRLLGNIKVVFDEKITENHEKITITITKSCYFVCK